MLKQHFHAVTVVCLLAVYGLRSSQRSEPEQFRINAHPTRDNLKASSDILSLFGVEPVGAV